MEEGQIIISVLSVTPQLIKQKKKGDRDVLFFVAA